MMGLLKYLPKNLLSRLVGNLVHWHLPKPLAKKTIFLFARRYKIDLFEAEKDYSEYRSIGDFFTRRLKPGLRPIATSDIVHPADSLISQIGKIKSGQLIQAKGREYDVNSLCKSFDARQNYHNGLYVTYYLCPTDYHRVHSPVSGIIKSATHIPGNLWPVNEWSVKNIENLFAVNERVIVEIETEFGTVSVIFVGATNVGKMEMCFDKDLITNHPDRRHLRRVSYENLDVHKGEELGVFHMGSTVVMLYPETVFNLKENQEAWQNQWKNKKVKMGESFL